MNLQTLHAVTLFLTAALLVRLVVEGLHGRYRAFFASLLFTLLSGAYLYFIPVKSNLYGLVFFGSTAVSWVLQFLVLRELCLLVFHDHPGIRAAVKIGIWVSLAVAVVIPLGILGIDKLRDAPSQFPILKRFFLLNQSVMFFLSVLFAGTVAIVTWFPVALRRNIVFYCFGFSITFIGESAALLLRNAVASPYWLDLAAQAHMLIGLTVVVIWLIWLNKAGEQPLVSVSTLLRPVNRPTPCSCWAGSIRFCLLYYQSRTVIRTILGNDTLIYRISIAQARAIGYASNTEALLRWTE